MNEICDLNYVTDIKILLKIAIRVQNYKVCKTLLDNIKELKYPLIFSDAVQQNNDNILDERNEFNDTPLNIAIWNEN
jgi:hypothetical protein